MDQEAVLITGASGSIGSELGRRVAELHSGILVLPGPGENCLWKAQLSLALPCPTLAQETDRVTATTRTACARCSMNGSQKSC